MSRPILVFLFAVACAIGALLVLGAGEASPLVWFAGAVGLVICLAGGAAGQPALMFAGATAMLAGFGFTLVSESSDAVDTLVFALLLWLSVELNMRSMELRRTVVPTRQATVSWIAGIGSVAAGTVLLWLVVSYVDSAAPTGGVLFRVLAVGVVVALAAIVAGFPRGRRNDPGLPG